MSTPVDAERAWQDLQRIRVPQERVYDEMERCASNAPGVTYTTAGIMWLFIASWGLELADWAFWLVLAVYVALLGTLAVLAARKDRVRLHRSRRTWRSVAPILAGMVITGTVIVVSGMVTRSLALPFGSLIQATVSAGAFLLFAGPANRWAVTSLRDHSGKAP